MSTKNFNWKQNPGLQHIESAFEIFLFYSNPGVNLLKCPLLRRLILCLGCFQPINNSSHYRIMDSKLLKWPHNLSQTDGKQQSLLDHCWYVSFFFPLISFAKIYRGAHTCWWSLIKYIWLAAAHVYYSFS